MLSEYKAMWLLVMFDLPTVTKEEKRHYTRFRKLLLKEGFMQLQFSVYAVYCSSRENAGRYYRLLPCHTPPNGHVRLLMITDRQFGDMVSLFGENEVEVEKEPEQMLLL